MKKTTFALAVAAAITAASMSIPALAATDVEMDAANLAIIALLNDNTDMSYEDAVAAAIAANPDLKEAIIIAAAAARPDLVGSIITAYPAFAEAIITAAVTARPDLVESIMVNAIAAYKAVYGSGSPEFDAGLQKMVSAAVTVVGAESPSVKLISNALKTSEIPARISANTLISAGVSTKTVLAETGSTGGSAPATSSTASPS